MHQTVEQLMQKEESKLEWWPISDVREHPGNPKFITHAELESLKTSIAGFPEMMLIRTGIVDEEGYLVAGNQRLKACKALGWDHFPVRRAKDLTPAQLKEFMIKDNVQWGEWDHDILKEEWNISELEGWGLKFDEGALPELDPKELPPTSQSRLAHVKQIRLNYTEEQAETVKKKLAEIAETPEHAVLILLKLKEKPKTVKEVAKNTNKPGGDK
jgi:ParB-like chromosome segregation protein Spo0J